MIKANQLTRFYGDVAAVSDLSFHVRRGEVMGLLGPNGAGKSTTMKMLTCFLPPSSGEASIGDVMIDDAIAVRRKVGYLPENAPSYADLDVQTHLRFIGQMHGIPKATLQDRIIEMAGACGLHSVIHRRIDELSKGFRQRVGLAASMLHDPECLIFDEPTTGLDPNQIVEIRHLVRRLAEKKTVLLSSHVLPEVEAACDRMMIIDDGSLRAIGTSKELAQLGHGGAILHVRMKPRSAAEAALQQVSEQFAEVKAEVLVEEDAITAVLRHPDQDIEMAEAMFNAAVKTGAILLELRPETARLEDVFRRITGGES